jgi:hypothetical protein
MESIVGIFQSVASAEQAVKDLLSSGMAEQSIVFLSNESPGGDGGVRASSEEKLNKVPTTDAEGDGMGKAMGAVVGGAVGASAGMAAGATVAASLLVPGVGTIFAIGVGAAAALGLGGAAAGAKAGDVAEHAVDAGIPKDDVGFYRELLRRGHSVVIANADSEEHAARAREVFKLQGSEDADAVRRDFLKAA